MAESKRTASAKRAAEDEPEPDDVPTTGAPESEPEAVGGKASANAKQREIAKRLAAAEAAE
jgi:hypothetical protein